MTEKNLIRVYTGATSEKRIDIIIKNYTKFIGIVDGYTAFISSTSARRYKTKSLLKYL